MNCNDCRDIVLDMARGVARAEAVQATSHIEECEACSRYLQQQRALTAGLHAVAAEAAKPPSSAMEERLMRAFDARAAAIGAPRRSRAANARWLHIAAALVLLASAIAAWRWNAGVTPPVSMSSGAQHASQAPGGGAADRVPAPAEAGAERVAAAEQPGVDGAPAGRSSGKSPVVPGAATKPTRPRTVQATGFVALPEASMLPPFERGEIVRVQVRLATLANLGFTVQPDAIDNTPINADLLVGQDGQPRAIRLVTETQAQRSRR